MKLVQSYVLIALSCGTLSRAFSIFSHGGDDHVQTRLGSSDDTSDRRLIELSPGESQWVTEEEKWGLKREGINFMDITDTANLGTLSATTKAGREMVIFPDKTAYSDAILPLMKYLSQSNMRHNLEVFTGFFTRYYKSEYGRQSAEWLHGRINDTLSETDGLDYGVHVRRFEHAWGQPSLIVTVPGKSNKTIVIGAHQDSVNLLFPSFLSAPGADDDGSGTVTILEALGALLRSDELRHGQAQNTVEFHWYSAEEGGLLGSQAVFSQYEKDGREVKAMLQQDMTGYVKGTLDAGLPEAVGVITDYVDPGLTEFIKKIIDNYCDIPYVLTRCGYACSDHASASKAGYPSAFVIESNFANSDHYIHTSFDTINRLSFPHMLQHARLTLGLAYELAFATL